MTKQEIELLRQAFQLGQQWVKDINDGEEPISFNGWLTDLEALERNEAEQSTLKQTAVEWLEEIYLTSGIDRNVHFSQAKRMEAEQMKQHDKKEVELTFGNHLKAKIVLDGNSVKVIDAMNGWGNNVPSDEIKIEYLNQK